MLALTGCLFLIIICGALAFGPHASASMRFGGWSGLVFFGLCGILAVIQLIPGASFLRLEDSGFTVRSCWRDHFYPWSDIESFGVARGTGSRDWVGFNFVPGSQLAVAARLKELNRSQAGYEAMLPDTYGWATSTLADHLDLWRRKSLGLAEPDFPAAVISGQEPGRPPAGLAWSNTRLKFTLGIGTLGLAALMGELYGKTLPFWVVLPVVLLPLSIFLFVQPNEGLADHRVRRLQGFGAFWYLAAAGILAIQFFSPDTSRAALIIYPVCLIVGAIPCVIVLWQLRKSRD
jgi:hypothetical protein